MNTKYDFTTKDEQFENCKFVQQGLKNTEQQRFFLCTVCSQCFITVREDMDGYLALDSDLGLYCMALRHRVDQGKSPIIDCTFFTPRAE